MENKITPFPKQRMPKRRLWRRIKKNYKYFLLILLAIILIFEFTKQIKDIFPPPEVEVIQAYYSKKPFLITFPAMIVASEKIYTAPIEGNIYFLKLEGEAVEKGDELVEINNTALEKLLTGKIEEKEEEILTLKQEQKKQEQNWATEEEALNLEIKKCLDALYKVLVNLEEEKKNKLQQKLSDIEQKKKELVKKREEFNQHISQKLNQYKIEKEALEERLKRECTQKVVSEEDGRISYTSDGLERVLTVEKVLLAPVWNPPSPKEFIRKSGDKVKVGGFIFKIISPQNAILLGRTGAEELKYFKNQIEREIFFPEKSLSVMGQLQKLFIRGYNQKSVELIFVLSQLPEKLYPPRKVIAQVKIGEFSGVLLPHSSLVRNNKRRGVYLVKEERASFLEVKVKEESSREVIVEGLPEGVLIIKDARGIKEGEKVKLKI